MESPDFADIVGTQVPAHGNEVAVASCDDGDYGEPSSPRRVKNQAVGQMWAVSGGSNYIPCEMSVNTLPSGQYIIQHSESNGVYFARKTVTTDDLLTLPDNNTQQVIETIKNFWNQKDRFVEMGFLWKRGIMLWGPPGSGKTSCLQQISQLFMGMGGISIYCDYPTLAATGLRMLRAIEPDRPIVCLLEDIDAIIQRHGESEILALLDGELQIDNVVFIATTNYPELLDKRLVNRPSRFDEIIYIGMPSAAARRMYLSTKHPTLAIDGNADLLQQWVEVTDGYSVAHMKELIVAVECLGRPLEESAERLRKMIDVPVSSDSTPDRKSVGFYR
jgi:SpoVK/Ycf46/Vps4 family AAA+-type ATPase